jgi:hypothetical protein
MLRLETPIFHRTPQEETVPYIRRVNEATVLDLFERLQTLERAAHRDPDPTAVVAFDAIYDLMRRSVLSNDQHRVALARVIGRFDSVRQPVPADPERDR